MRKIALASEISLKDIKSLTSCLNAANGHPEILIDLSAVRFFELIPMTLLLGKVKGWVKDGKKLRITLPESSRAGPYMQRMDFYRVCGIDTPEHFARHTAKGRFVEFEVVNRGSTRQASNIATKVAEVLAPDQSNEQDSSKAGFFNSLEYAVSELVLNTVQHSMGDGYIGAQYYGWKDTVQLAIADTGTGIWESFKRTSSPVVDSIHCDGDAISQSLQNGVSCNGHFADFQNGSSENAGVGLTFLSELARKTGGSFVVSSGEAMIIDDVLCEFGINNGYSGTFSAFSYPRSQLDNFEAVIESVKEEFLDSTIDIDQFNKVFE